MEIISCKLMGGLGNYLFQISTSYSISLRDNKNLLCDISDSVVPHKPYSKYTSNIFRKINFSNDIGNFTPFGETGFNYSPIPNINGNVKLFGYFQSEKYFLNHRKEILEIFEIDEITEEKINQNYGDILSLDTCSIHIRRGDYLYQQQYHPIQTMEYYNEAIEKIGLDKHFLIFSDDIEWCIDNFNFLDNKTFVSNNLDYEDLYLMSKCNNNIIANSSFSWWGSWLNKNDDKIVIAPKNWFGSSYSHLETSDLYCEKWIIL